MIDQAPPIFRFAPSPNGALHLGHAYSAVVNFQAAKEIGGRFFIRVEDIDQTRCTPELEAAMLEDLSWLGLEWEEPVRRQSDHFDAYAVALNALEEADLVYRSYLSRGDIRRIVEAHEETGKVWPRDPDGAPHYPGKDYEDGPRDDDNYALRLNTERAVAHVSKETSWLEAGDTSFDLLGEEVADVTDWGDVVLARRDTPTSYHLSVVVDDALQKVSHIVRGQDLKAATGVHRLLQELLGFPQPVYHHHALILDDDGRKLSKSRGDTSLASLRNAGATREDVLRMIGLD